MERVVDIYEAKNFYFNQKIKRRLRFLCSDELCRQIKEPVVIGVNYWKLVGGEEQFCNRPHFRRHGDFAHHNLCFKLELYEAKKELEKELSRNSPSGRRKLSDVVDIFSPFDGQEAGDTRLIEQEDAVYREVRKIASKHGRIEALKEYLRKSPTRSRMLQEVVSCFITLSPDERRSTVLRIGGIRETYETAFRKISQIDRHRNNIYFGGVRVSHYKQKSGDVGDAPLLTGYVLNFYDPVIINGAEHRVSLFVSVFKLARYKYRASLKHLLEEAATKNIPYLRCFFWGGFEVVPEHQSVKILIGHFNNIHFVEPPAPRR